ncbi:VWA domain-containing protein [Streptomyces exfoliatus]|uniref:VWA domain-containing protein n=1 Tax=Streptomyces exfoliatus TaxID=1905 RepID=UPI0004C9EF00|nr:VWA domain-containing protein [Streptomyces exfoliatus]
MGIRSMLRKVFGRDREDTPATSVPPQTRETSSTSTSSDTPEDAARRAADDLVAASFDNPQIPKARARARAGAPVTATAPAPVTVDTAEATEATEAEEPKATPAVEAEAETPVVEAATPEPVKAEEPVSATAPEAETPEPVAAEESVSATAPEAETEVAAAAAESASEPTAPVAEEEPVTPTAEAETELAPEAPEPEVTAEVEDAPATAAADEPQPTEEAEANADADADAEEVAAEQEQQQEVAAAAVTEPAEPETDATEEPQAEAVLPAEPETTADVNADAPAAEEREPVAAAAEAEAAPASTDTDADTDAPQSAGPALTLPAVKAAAPHLADAYKAAGAQLRKQGLEGARAAVYLVVDRSGSMRGYFKDGSVQRLAEQVTALAAHLDEAATVTTVFFSTDIDGTVDLTPADLTPTRVEEINGTLGRLGRTNYHRAVEEVLAHHEKADPARPALVVFQTDGAPESKTAATQALMEAAGRPLHWRFVVWGEEDNKAFDFVRKLDGAPRTAAYFAGVTPLETAHAAFYRGLLAGLEF